MKRAARRHADDEISFRQAERDIVGRSKEDSQRSPRPAHGDGNDGDDAFADAAGSDATRADGTRSDARST